MSLRPWERPETEFPVLVPVGTMPFDTTGPSAVAITGVLAYSNGFEFLATRLVRRDAFPPRSAPRPGQGRGLGDYGGCSIGVAFGDGGQAFTGGHVEPSYPDEPDRPFLFPSGKNTRGFREDQRWWVWPLPPPGQLEFICRLGEAESRISMDAQLGLDASQQSLPAWPDL